MLVFDDGTVLEGEGFGMSATASGEVVFNTGMVGYPEALTDPSYRGQILTLTYPLVGNYGIPDPGAVDRDNISKFFESDRIQARGLVVHDLSHMASHWNAAMTLDEWMHNEGVPGISGIDTRQLTKKLRTGGVMMAVLAVSDSPIDSGEAMAALKSSPRYGSEQLMENAGEAVTYGSDPETVVVIDTGVKNAIIRNVRRMGYRAVVLPWNATYGDVMSYRPGGVVLSSGPGDPQMCTDTVRTVRRLIKEDVPMLGICLGAQIMGIAGGASTYKLKYGHRGQNKPCMNLETGQVYVTSQNHGYGIEPGSVAESEFELWFKNADDGTVEGIRHKTRRSIAVQFHPEASPGPYDCGFVFDELKRLMEEGDTAKR